MDILCAYGTDAALRVWSYKPTQLGAFGVSMPHPRIALKFEAFNLCLSYVSNSVPQLSRFFFRFPSLAMISPFLEFASLRSSLLRLPVACQLSSVLLPFVRRVPSCLRSIPSRLTSAFHFSRLSIFCSVFFLLARFFLARYPSLFLRLSRTC